MSGGGALPWLFLALFAMLVYYGAILIFMPHLFLP